MRHSKKSEKEIAESVRDLMANLPALALHKFLTGTKPPVWDSAVRSEKSRKRKDQSLPIRSIVNHPILSLAMETVLSSEKKRTRRASIKKAASSKCKKNKCVFG